MRRSIFSVVWIAMAYVAIADEPNKDRAALEGPPFVGKWAITKAQPEGSTKNAHWLQFNGEGTYAALDKDGKELWAGTYEITRTTKPGNWDHRSDDARKMGKDQLGIYELNGDTLRVACVGGQWRGNEWGGRPRPKAFEPQSADVVLELSRAKHSGKLAHPNNERGASSMTEEFSRLATEFMRTINKSDPNGLIGMFCDDAIVDDAGRIVRGSDAIQKWAAHDIFAASVTLDALDVSKHASGGTITAKLDGIFDRKGLPDPLVMTFDIALRGGKIAKLTLRLAGK